MARQLMRGLYHAAEIRNILPAVASSTTAVIRAHSSAAEPALDVRVESSHWGAGLGSQRSNMAAVLHGVHDLRFEEAPPLPDRPAPGNVRIAVKAVGICRSDVHYLERGRIGPFVVDAPMVIGHETAGTVAEVGDGVSGLEVGDRVALEPGIPCWCNRLAKEGRYNLDPDIRFFATPPYHGSLAEFVDHPADFCFRLPDHVSHEEGAMCEPLSVGVHACRRAAVAPGKRVAVLGAGPIGLVTILAAKAFGASRVVVTDMMKANLALASTMGATDALLVDPAAPSEEAAQSLRAAFGGEGPDIVIDCAGFENTMQTAIRACEPGGRIVLVGMGQEDMALPMALASIREIDIYGSFRYCNTYPLCVSMLESGAVDVKPMITHRFGFSAQQIAAGFDCAVRSRETKAVKVMFNLD